MGSKSGLALKGLQWFNRVVQFLCAALLLGVFSYFIADLNDHDLHIDTHVRAVEGISGVAVLYTLIGLVFLCCLAGLAFASFIAFALDLCFIGCFIYVAHVNRKGAGTCNSYFDTPFGRGQSSYVSEPDGFAGLPRASIACKLQRACFSVSIIAIFFFVLSILTEMMLFRHHRKQKQARRLDHASSRGGFFGRFRHDKNPRQVSGADQLPVHPSPDQFNRRSDATEATGITYGGRGASADYQKQEVGYGHQPTGTITAPPLAQTGRPIAPAANAHGSRELYTDGVHTSV